MLYAEKTVNFTVTIFILLDTHISTRNLWIIFLSIYFSIPCKEFIQIEPTKTVRVIRAVAAKHFCEDGPLYSKILSGRCPGENYIQQRWPAIKFKNSMISKIISKKIDFCFFLILQGPAFSCSIRYEPRVYDKCTFLWLNMYMRWENSEIRPGEHDACSSLCRFSKNEEINAE